MMYKYFDYSFKVPFLASISTLNVEGNYWPPEKNDTGHTEITEVYLGESRITRDLDQYQMDMLLEMVAEAMEAEPLDD